MSPITDIDTLPQPSSDTLAAEAAPNATVPTDAQPVAVPETPVAADEMAGATPAQALAQLEDRKGAGPRPAVRVRQTSHQDGTVIDSSELAHIGSTVVGDTRASLEQNSEATVDQTPTSPILTDTISLHSRPTPTASAQPTEASIQDLLGELSDRHQLAEIPEGLRERVHTRTGWTAPASAAQSPAPTFHQYVLNAYDVHEMGPEGTPSAINIWDGEGRLIRQIRLSEGDSQYTIDLPPGDYTFEAIAGLRADPKSYDAEQDDWADNFRFELYDTGSQAAIT